MRKRRRLADKLTIFVCAVLVAVSAFFYAPMEVDASSFDSSSVVGNYAGTSTSQNVGACRILDEPLYFDNVLNLDIGQYYLVTYSGTSVFKTSVKCMQSSHAVSMDFGGLSINLVNSTTYYTDNPHVYNFSGSFIYKAIENPEFSFDSITYCSGFNSILAFTATDTVTVNIDSIEKIETSDGEAYQNGYNAGFSDGESVGYGNGYSNGFADGEASVDTDVTYDEAFQAGKDSVDTQSYYDAGYQAGYQVAYSEGYDSGYDEGYQSAMDRIGGWGADTADYPVYITSSSSESGFLSGYVYGNSQVYDEENIILNFDINPNHIYRFDVKLGFPRQTSYSNVYGSYTAVYFCAGGVDYFISPTVNFGQGTYESVYVRGDVLSSSFSKKGVVNVVSSSVTNPDLPVSFSFDGFWHDVQVYDVGPIGNMQNHIANQTDQLTGGYNDSQGNSVNNEFSSGLNDFETAEDSLFATATTGMKDFTFFDLSSVPAMLTGMSFVGSIMTGWFNQAGGASGVGIVLSILFSIMLVAMVLGLYRWYQSKGGKD